MQNAVGFSKARGDSVQVQRLPFDTTAAKAAKKELAQANAALRDQVAERPVGRRLRIEVERLGVEVTGERPDGVRQIDWLARLAKPTGGAFERHPIPQDVWAWATDTAGAGPGALRRPPLRPARRKS